MSTPRKLKAEASGVYATPADSAHLRTLDASSGNERTDVDLSSARSKAELMRAFAKALDFPAHFGENWDALEESLGDAESMHAGYIIRLRNAAQARHALGADWDTLLDVLRETARYWKARGKPFVVLVDGGTGLPAWK